MYKEYVVYAVQHNEQDYLEETVKSCGNMQEAKRIKKELDRIGIYKKTRIAIIDLGIKPDFVKSIAI